MQMKKEIEFRCVETESIIVCTHWIGEKFIGRRYEEKAAERILVLFEKVTGGNRSFMYLLKYLCFCSEIEKFQENISFFEYFKPDEKFL